MTHTVNRWHAHPSPALRGSGDTIDTHHARCEAMARELWPDAGEAFFEMVAHHDEPEKWLGDMPYPAKAAFPALARAYARAEVEIVDRHRIPWPKTHHDKMRIKLVDRIDAYRWMLTHDPELAERWEWKGALSAINSQCRSLNMGDAVSPLLSPY